VSVPSLTAKEYEQHIEVRRPVGAWRTSQGRR